MTRSILLSLLFSASLSAADPFPSERILIPLLTAPVHGAFGWEFHTKLRVYNHFESDITIQGIAPPCLLSACPTVPGTIVEAGSELDDIEPPPTANPLLQPPYWAFVSVTNNDTQVITTITPQQ